MSDSLRFHALWPTRLLCPHDFPVKNTAVGCHVLLQEIFPTQGSNLNLLHLMHWQVDALPLTHLGSPHFCLLFIFWLLLPLCSWLLPTSSPVFPLLPWQQMRPHVFVSKMFEEEIWWVPLVSALSHAYREVRVSVPYILGYWLACKTVGPSISLLWTRTFDFLPTHVSLD